nr:hypothetical protein [Tanacetum cinerariifolium]
MEGSIIQDILERRIDKCDEEMEIPEKSTNKQRAKQVPVAGCLPGPISIFFMVWNSLYTCNRVKATVMLTLQVNRAMFIFEYLLTECLTSR